MAADEQKKRATGTRQVKRRGGLRRENLTRFMAPVHPDGPECPQRVSVTRRSRGAESWGSLHSSCLHFVDSFTHPPLVMQFCLGICIFACGFVTLSFMTRFAACIYASLPISTPPCTSEYIGKVYLLIKNNVTDYLMADDTSIRFVLFLFNHTP